MEIRQITEQRENLILAPYAAKSANSLGRLWPEQECAVRTAFQRDRDRILHSKAFRRLKHKTQVFIQPEGDHYRTRLTHTLEVSQVARTIARGLLLNEDLTEAIALGHDLGHTPFGHAGERALNQLVPGGFQHNEQSLRVVDTLEKERGLNLTLEVRDGIRCHTGLDQPRTLEGAVVRLADRIAYINHDIDDATRAGLLQIEAIPGHILDTLGHRHSQRIHTMVLDVIMNSQGRGEICMSSPVAKAMDELRDFLFAHVYVGSEAKRDEGKAEQMIGMLYQTYLRQPNLLPFPYQQICRQESAERAVVDYIAGMTDRFIISQFEQMFIPEAWNV
jgi:dGTPase